MLTCAPWFELLQLFFVNRNKGWGIRTREALRRGTFLFEFAGEVVTNAELLRRGDRTKYAVALDADWESEAQNDDESLLCIDATDVTNVARWLNHRYEYHCGRTPSLSYGSCCDCR